MLKFWKKAGQKGKESELQSADSPKVVEFSSFGTEDIDRSLSETLVYPKYSRLSKPLVEIMSDTEAIGYFIQYLEAMNVTCLAKCLLDIDHLNATLVTDSAQLSWEDVKGVKKLINDETGKISWELSNGVNYTNHVACDISSYCNPVAKICKTFVRAATESRLSEMQEDERVNFESVMTCDRVSQKTIDALTIFYKYFSYSAPVLILLSEHVFQRLLNKLTADVSQETFLEVRNVIFSVLQNEFYYEYLRSEVHCKYQITILTGTEVAISDILYNESALFYFMEYLENEGAKGLLEFWMAANNFKEQYLTQGHCYDPVQAQSDAMVLYEKYFSLQASRSLHLGDKVRFLVEESICREEGPLPTCFEPVQALIVRLIETRFLGPFLQSQLYFNFLSDVISTVNAGPLRPGGSDCSSEISISATNTLLASEDRKKDHRWEPTDLNIDTRQLNDPDSLWRRGRPHGLTLGRVNALGRFQTDLEPEPDRRIGFETRITKAMKRFVHLEEDKSKEEMAWQVAEMIVKDVTSLTMPSNQNL